MLKRSYIFQLRDLSDNQRYNSGEGAFADESRKSDSFIPTSLSKDETPRARAREGSLSTDERDRMVQELPEPIFLEVRDSGSTVSAQGNFAYPQIAPNVEVEEMGEDFELPDCEGGDEADVQDHDCHLLCTSAKLREHKLIPPDAKLQREKYQAPSFTRKPKVNIATPTTTPQNRKSEVTKTPVVDLSKKLQKVAQDKGKKVMMDLATKARTFMALQEKFVSDDFVAKVKGAPTEDLLSRSAELALQIMTVYSQALGASIKDLDFLKKQNLALQEGGLGELWNSSSSWTTSSGATSLAIICI
uniref:Uncharacterized protein n=1 Tax=Cannabis sativa TaxID=3483 RepID=A0A803Q2J7_CANSA